MYPYIVQGNSVTVVIGNKPHTVAKSHLAYNRLREAIRVGDWELVEKIIDPTQAVLEYGNGRITIQGDRFFWDNVEWNNSLTRRMIDMLREGFAIDPMIRFMERLDANPSHSSIEHLYMFMEKTNLPITNEGCFIAYKRVNDDYTDVHSGTVSNKPASMLTGSERAQYPLFKQGKKQEVTVSINEAGETVVSMKRGLVDDDRNIACSVGLHVCSEGYLQSFGGNRIIMVRVDPADVVSVPNDHSDSKMRVCRYTVIGEIGDSKDEIEQVQSVPVVTEDAAFQVYRSEF
jgi:hypothetical protein